MKPKQKELIKEIYQKNATRTGLTMSKSVLREKLQETFPELFKPEKYEPKVGEWTLITTENVTNLLMKFQGFDQLTYGIGYNGEWFDRFVPGEDWTYKPASLQEIESRLRQYASEVLGIGNDAKIEYSIIPTNLIINDGRWNIRYEKETDTLYNKNGCIYSNGKWATPKKQLPSDVQSLVDKFGKEELIKILNQQS